MYRLLALCLCYGLLNHAASTENTTPFFYEHCDDLQPQENVQLQSIVGPWYVIKVFQHKTDKKLYHGGDYEVAACPYIRITYVGSESELKLYWEETTGNIEYRFKIYNKLHPGRWMSSGAQNGTLLLTQAYNQFAGTVYVMEAMKDHIVLTFCSPNTQFYSIILARTTEIGNKQLRNITNNITDLNLPITETKRTCRSSSSIAKVSVVWLVVAFGLLHTYVRHVAK